MAWTLDARIPVSFGAWPEAGPPAAWVGPDPSPAGAVTAASLGEAHLAGCTCCAGRTPAGEALDRLFQARVRGACPWFDRVVVAPDAAAAVAAALREDPLALARFRPA